MSQNSKLGDAFIQDMLVALSEGEVKIETLNIGECDIDATDNDHIERITGSGVEMIAGYVSQCKLTHDCCLSALYIVLTLSIYILQRFRRQISI